MGDDHEKKYTKGVMSSYDHYKATYGDEFLIQEMAGDISDYYDYIIGTLKEGLERNLFKNVRMIRIIITETEKAKMLFEHNAFYCSQIVGQVSKQTDMFEDSF